ncbi:MAG: hypothetical protein KF830_17300 [Planctomycetes bacterium]|nr:hypothetical protein [Planctomycetota bacterium]
MATNPASPPVPTSPAPHAEEHTGVYGFFRRHQKKLLYTAGLFTLLTFSVTGPMLEAVDSLFGRRQELPSILVGGARVKLDPLDYQYGQIVARNLQALPPVMPPLGTGEAGSNDLPNMLAILRRAAIAEGVDVSMVEVDRAIEALREQSKVESAARLAGYRGFGSLAQFREVVREAMRIGTYVRLQTLALDCSDAKVLERLLADREKITFRVAVFDEKAVEEQLKASTTVSDDDLRAWLDGKTDAEKNRLQAFDSNRLELRFGGLLLAEGQFDPAQWQDVLKDFQPPEDQLRRIYEQEKDQRYKLDGDAQWRPFEEVQADVLRTAQAEQVMQHLLGELRKRIDEALKVPNEDLQRCQTELDAANQALEELQRKLAENPGEAAALEEQIRLAKEVLPAKQAAVDEASTAVKTMRADWDFPAAFAELTRDKAGFVQRATTGRRNFEELRDLDAAGVDFGQWPGSAQARGLLQKGDLCFSPGRASKAIVLYQTTDVEVRPLKPWDKLKPLLEGAWYTEKAKAEGEAKKAQFEAALLRLAKGQMPDKVAELEATRTTRRDERFAEWERTTQAAIAEAQGWLQRLSAGTQAQVAWQKKLDRLQDEFAKRDEKRAEIETEVGKAVDDEIAVEAKKHHAAVLEAAAAEAGFTVTTVGPQPRDLSRRPRFDKAYDPTTVFLFRSHAELEAGASTGVVQDATNRRWLCAVADKVEPLTPADVTRREFESLRTGDGFASYATQQAYIAYQQAFTTEALEKRYDLQRPVGDQQMDAPQR